MVEWDCVANGGRASGPNCWRLIREMGEGVKTLAFIECVGG